MRLRRTVKPETHNKIHSAMSLQTLQEQHATFQVYGNHHHGLGSAGAGLGQPIFTASNSRQRGLKSCPTAGYKKGCVL